MLYLCKRLHFTENNDNTTTELFCKQCNKTIMKYKLYKFQRINGSYYLAQQSKSCNRKATQPSKQPDYVSAYNRMKYVQSKNALWGLVT